jgi:hypothetical protein
MKRIFLVLVVIAQVAVAGVALANTVTVDFSVLGSNTTDITVSNNPNGLTLNGVNFLYDNLGIASEFAQAQAAGIFGTTYGALNFTFDAPANGLNFNFALLNPSGPMDYGLIAIFSNKDGSNDFTEILPMPQNGAGSLAYSGGPFEKATMYFYCPYVPNDSLFNPDTDTQHFTVDTISYNAVPIPGALPLVGSGLLVLAGWGWRSRKKS